ncbi:hypothetical protein Tco_0042805, partial [Tanacetum coccineum]
MKKRFHFSRGRFPGVSGRFPFSKRFGYVIRHPGGVSVHPRSLPPRVQGWLNSFEEDDPKKVVHIDISNIKDAYGKPLRKIICNRLTSDPHIDEIPDSVQLYREAKQRHAQRLADINQAK